MWGHHNGQSCPQALPPSQPPQVPCAATLPSPPPPSTRLSARRAWRRARQPSLLSGWRPWGLRLGRAAHTSAQCPPPSSSQGRLRPDGRCQLHVIPLPVLVLPPAALVAQQQPHPAPSPPWAVESQGTTALLPPPHRQTCWKEAAVWLPQPAWGWLESATSTTVLQWHPLPKIPLSA